jgi:two-component system LytT family response regulator/two-component system response regulator LytT
MPLSAVIVDDEQLARDELAYLLKDVGDINVVAQGKNGVEAVNLIREHNPDLVFLDVQMPGLDGFGVIKKLLDRKVPLPKIVFATAFDQYAVKAFEVNAVDYLLKPFDKKRVVQSVQKARAKLESSATSSDKLETLVRMLESQKPQTSKILIKAAGRLFLVDQKDICYASIEDGVISVATSGPAGMEGQSNCRTLEELLDSLDPNLFWRAHRSYLVNINRIKEVVPWFKSSYQLRMDDKKRVVQSVQKARAKLESSTTSSDKLETLVRMLESQKPQTSKILIKAAGRLFLVDQKDICYASIEDGVISVATSGPAGMEGQSNCRTLEELLDSLDPNLFWRAHRSYLVNINRIKEVVPWFKSSYQLRMDDKKQTEIPVSRAQTRRLRELFGL